MAVVWAQVWRRAMTSDRARTPAGAEIFAASLLAGMLVVPLLLGVWLWWLLTGGGPVRWLGLQRYAIVNVMPRPSRQRLEQTLDAVRERLTPIPYDGEIVEGKTYTAPPDADHDWAADALETIRDRRVLLVLTGRRGFREGTVESLNRAEGHVTLRTYDGVEQVQLADIASVGLTPRRFGFIPGS